VLALVFTLALFSRVYAALRIFKAHEPSPQNSTDHLTRRCPRSLSFTPKGRSPFQPSKRSPNALSFNRT
jgi:hypothetical protein